MKSLFTKIIMLLVIISLSSCGMSKLVSVDKGENTINYYNSIDKTIFLAKQLFIPRLTLVTTILYLLKVRLLLTYQK